MAAGSVREPHVVGEADLGVDEAAGVPRMLLHEAEERVEVWRERVSKQAESPVVKPSEKGSDRAMSNHGKIAVHWLRCGKSAHSAALWEIDLKKRQAQAIFKTELSQES